MQIKAKGCRAGKQLAKREKYKCEVGRVFSSLHISRGAGIIALFITSAAGRERGRKDVKEKERKKQSAAGYTLLSLLGSRKGGRTGVKDDCGTLRRAIGRCIRILVVLRRSR